MKIAIDKRRKGERGQTIALVALSLVSLLGVAALAIDVVSLYVAKAEAQRAADSAALAGAMMYATSGFATLPASFGSPVCTSGGPGAAAAVNRQAEAAAVKNLISNQPATVSSISCDVGADQNPQVTVIVRQNNLPTYFSRIWSQSTVSVTATATAEAYNAANHTVQVAGVKPWLLPDCQMGGALPGCAGKKLIDPSSHLPATGVIGSSIDLTRINPVTGATTPAPGHFFPLQFGSNARTCPLGGGYCGTIGTSDYQDDISCSNHTKVSCGIQDPLSNPISVRTTGNMFANRTLSGTKCLINANNDTLAAGQDEFIPRAGAPPTIRGGADNRIPALRGVDNISRSDSIVTVPLYDGAQLCTGPGVCPTPITVTGFLKLAITQTLTGGPQVRALVLDGVGCSATPAPGGPTAGTTSPVSVRLIHQ